MKDSKTIIALAFITATAFLNANAQTNKNHKIQKTEAVTIVDSLFTLFSKGQIPQALALYTADAVLSIPEGLPHGGKYVGPTGVGESINKIYGRADIKFERGFIYPLGANKAIAFNKFAEIKPKGSTKQSITVPLAEVYTVKNGKIIDAQIWYWDTAAVVDLLK